MIINKSNMEKYIIVYMGFQFFLNISSFVVKNLYVEMGVLALSKSHIFFICLLFFCRLWHYMWEVVASKVVQLKSVI